MSKKSDQKLRTGIDKLNVYESATDGFPAYELWITDETNNNSYLLLNSNPIESKESPRALFPPMEKSYNLKGNSRNKKPATEVNFDDKKNTPESK